MSDTGTVLEGLSRRIQTLEQQITTPENMPTSDNTFEDIWIGPEGSQVQVDNVITAPAAPDVTLGTYFENSWAFVEWDAVPKAASYDVLLEEHTDDVGGSPVFTLTDARRVGGNSAAFEHLNPGAEYRVSVIAANRLGTPSAASPFTEFTALADVTLPAAPVFAITAGLRTVTVSWDEVADSDVVNGKGLYEVQIDTVNTFDSGALRSERTSSTFAVFTDQVQGQQYYLRMRTIDSSGNPSAWTATQNYTHNGANTKVLQGDITANSILANHIQAGQITSDHITTPGLDAAVIKFGTMDGDRITANTLSVQALETSTMTAADILISGGSLRLGTVTPSGSSGSGWIMNSSGIRGFTSGVLQSTLAPDGTISIKGTLTSGSTITGAAMSSGTIDGTTITGGTFRSGLAAAPFHYGIWDNAGLRFNKNGSAAYTGGTSVFNFDTGAGTLTLTDISVTGNSTLRGTFDTTAGNTQPGVKISGGDIFLYPGTNAEYGGWLDSYMSGGAERFRIRGPVPVTPTDPQNLIELYDTTMAIRTRALDISWGTMDWCVIGCNNYVNIFTGITVLGRSGESTGVTARVNTGIAATLSDDTGTLQIGSQGDTNLGLGQNTIQCRDGNAAAATLNLNPRGGDVTVATTSGNPSVYIRSTQGAGSLTNNAGALVVGNSGAQQLALGGQSLQSRNGTGGDSLLGLNPQGGNVTIGGGATVTNITMDGRISSDLNPSVNSTSSTTGFTLGNSTFKWRVLWAFNGTIQTSDVRDKKEIEPTPLGLEFVRKLKPVKYKWAADDKEAQPRYGFLADEVAVAAGDIGFAGVVFEDGIAVGMNYAELHAPTIAAVQTVTDRLEDALSRIAALEAALSKKPSR